MRWNIVVLPPRYNVGCAQGCFIIRKRHRGNARMETTSLVSRYHPDSCRDRDSVPSRLFVLLPRTFIHLRDASVITGYVSSANRSPRPQDPYAAAPVLATPSGRTRISGVGTDPLHGGSHHAFRWRPRRLRRRQLSALCGLWFKFYSPGLRQGFVQSAKTWHNGCALRSRCCTFCFWRKIHISRLLDEQFDAELPRHSAHRKETMASSAVTYGMCLSVVR